MSVVFKLLRPRSKWKDKQLKLQHVIRQVMGILDCWLMNLERNLPEMYTMVRSVHTFVTHTLKQLPSDQRTWDLALDGLHSETVILLMTCLTTVPDAFPFQAEQEQLLDAKDFDFYACLDECREQSSLMAYVCKDMSASQERFFRKFMHMYSNHSAVSMPTYPIPQQMLRATDSLEEANLKEYGVQHVDERAFLICKLFQQMRFDEVHVTVDPWDGDVPQ